MTVKITTPDGVYEVIEQPSGAKVYLLVEPSEEWLAKLPPPEEPKKPEAGIEERISDLEEALALLHMEVTRIDTSSTP